jgi:type I restriction enzyme R subunit
MARHLTDLLKGTDRFAKTLVFCVDQEHAAEMRQELINLNSDLVQQYPDYVCRVTADEGAIGLTHLSHFQDVDKPARHPHHLPAAHHRRGCRDGQERGAGAGGGLALEFKQIVGRGTR